MAGREEEGLLGGPDDHDAVRMSTIYGTAKRSGANETKNNMGTFTGVFMPCILGIWGVIIYLRLSWVVGQAGLLFFLLILTIGYVVIGLTMLSLGAISTNGLMKGGGMYYMLSRAIGPELGGAVGMIFYLANLVGCAFYLTALADAIQSAIPSMPQDEWTAIALASGILVFVTTVSVVGAKAYATSGMFIFAALWFTVFSDIGSIWFSKSEKVPGHTGVRLETLKNNLYANFAAAPEGAGQQTFQSVFAVFFPTVTGVLAGSNFSGDLADPAKSLPKGTFAAMGVTYTVYAVIGLGFASTVSREVLQSDYFISQRLCYYEYVITAGIILATLSSALNNQIGCSRILQAIARDELFPYMGLLKRGSKKGDEPRHAVLFSWVVIQALLFIGNVNQLAEILTMFFMLSYTIINMACLALTVSAHPNYRPIFTLASWPTALLGTILCLTAMFFINPLQAGIATVLLLLIVGFLAWRAPAVQWGFLSQAIMYHQVRKYLLQLDVRKEHVKYWRPQLLLLVSHAHTSLPLIDFCNNMKRGGLLLLGNVLVGDVQSMGARHKEDYTSWVSFIANAGVKAFPELVIAKTIREGVANLIQVSGLGALRPNTLVLGFPENAEDTTAEITRGKTYKRMSDAAENFRRGPPASGQGAPMAADDYVGIIRDVLFFNKNVVIARHFETMDKDSISSRASTLRSGGVMSSLQNMSIDVWPTHQLVETTSSDHSITLALLLGWITSTKDIWRKFTRLRVITFVFETTQVNDEIARLTDILRLARIPAEILVLSLTSEQKTQWNNAIETNKDRDARFDIVNALMREQSDRTGVIFTTIPSPTNDSQAYLRKIDRLTRDLPPLLGVQGIGSFIATEM